MIQLYQTLDLRPIGIPQTLRLSQYDSDFEIIFELTNFDGAWILDTDTTAEVQGTKTDGHGYSADAVFDDQLKTVTIAGDVQMTAAAGRNVYEVVLFHDGDRLGSKNFILDVERAALDAETTASDSKIKNFTEMVESAEEAAETATAAAEAAEEALANMDAGLSDEAKEALLSCFRKVAWIDDQGQTYYDALETALYGVRWIGLNTYSLAASGTGGKAQLVATTIPAGGAVTWVSSNTAVATVSASGLVTFIGYGSATITATSNGKTASCSVLVAQKTVSSISATYTQSGTVYVGDSLDSLKPDLVVTATWSDSTQTTVPAAEYTLSGELAVGTSTITVSYGGKTASFDVVVSEAELTSISAVFNQGQATIYEYDTLESLRQYLTVTALYSDSTTEEVTTYTLTGSLSSAQSVITATYQEKTATFTVNVTIDSTLLYYAPRGHVIDGTSATMIDTGIKLADTDKTITVLFDVTDSETLTGTRSPQLLFNWETTGGNAGYNIAETSAASGNDFVKTYSFAVGSTTSMKATGNANGAHRLQGALQHVANSAKYKCTLYVDGVAVFENVEADTYFRTTQMTAYIGARYSGTFNWNGVINLMNFYSRNLSLSEIKSLLGVA